MGTKKAPKKIKCAHDGVSEYNVITPNQHLKPIGGKIYWHIDESSLTDDMDKYQVIYAFEQAFKKWQPLFDPIVIEATGEKSQSQITIKFKNNGDVDLPHPFNSGVLAYAYAPSGESKGLHADMFFNDAYAWSDMHKAGHINLFKVAVHEIGHTLNSGHSTNIKDIMYPQYQPNDEVNITLDTQNFVYDTYKPYGVAKPNSTSAPKPVSSDIKAVIKSIFRSKGEVARLQIGQLNSFGTTLGLIFKITDKPQNKIDKIWAIINAMV